MPHFYFVYQVTKFSIFNMRRKSLWSLYDVFIYLCRCIYPFICMLLDLNKNFGNVTELFFALEPLDY